MPDERTYLLRNEIARLIGDDPKLVRAYEELQRAALENLPELIEDAALSLESLDARVDVVEDALTDGAILVQDEGGAGVDAHTVNIVGAGASVAVAAGVATVTVPGVSPSGIWSLHGSFDFDVIADAAQADFTGLAGATDIMILVRNVILSVSGVLAVRASVDNGSTFYAASGDYVSVPEAGNEAATTAIGVIWTTSTTLARSGAVIIYGANVANAPKAGESVNQGTATQRIRYFVASDANDIDAVRVFPNAGGNITAGKIYCFKR